ncbi:Tellurite resistance protein TerB, partial [Mesorhizobium sp. M8A.F.Ca.ET.181.01.1.1]
EVRVLQLIRLKLDLDTLTVAAIARATKARLRTLT